MSAYEADEQELIELYRQYRQTPKSAATDTDPDMFDDLSATVEQTEYSPEEQAIIEDYKTYKQDRVSNSTVEPVESSSALVSSIVEQCTPILSNTASAQSSAWPELKEKSPSRSLFSGVSNMFRKFSELLLAPSGALVATAVVASLVLFPMLNGDQGGLTTFAGSELYSEASGLSSLNTYYPQSVTRNSALPSGDNSHAYHYSIGHLVAGLAIAIKGGNAESGPVFATQLGRMIASDQDIDDASVMRIQEIWDDQSRESEVSDTTVKSLSTAFEQLIDSLNARNLTSTEKSFEHLGAWTLGSRVIVRAAVEDANVDEDLLARFVEEFTGINEKIQKTTGLLTKQRRSLTAFEALINDIGSELTQASRQRLMSVSESLDEIHIAYKN